MAIKIFKTILSIILFIILYSYYNLVLVRIFCDVLLLSLIWIPDSKYLKLFSFLFKK